MSDVKFSCDQCGKTYKWKPDFAGRKVKCKCGYVMTAPKAPPVAADEPDMDALYDLADAGQQAAAAAPAVIRCPSCTGEMEPGAQVCPSCGFNLKTGRKSRAAAAASGGGGGGGGGGVAVATMPAVGGGGGGAAVATAPGSPLAAFRAFGAPRKGLQKDAPETGVVSEFVLPIVFIVVGLGVAISHATMFGATTISFADAMMRTGTQLVLSLVLMTVACALCIQWGEIAFGSPGPAALKLAALAIGPSAVAFLVSSLLNDHWGLVGFFLAFGMYFTMCHYLFEWDMSEKWVVTGVTLVICMLAVPMATAMMFEPAKSATRNDDAFVKARQDMGRTVEFAQWLKDGNGRIVGDLPRGLADELATQLYALGATDVQVQPDGPQAAELHVRMPKDANKRKAIVDYYNDFAKQHKVAGCEDKGGKWMLLRYLPIDDPPMMDLF